MIWSILVASHVRRSKQLLGLAGMLAPQLSADVEVLVLWNRGSRTIGDYRQLLVEEAAGEYVSHVDDDDRVPDHYCKSILDALETRPDYVGFEVAVEDRSDKPINQRWRQYRAIHSLDYDRWFQDGNVFYRDVSHLNPVRRDLALQATFEGLRAEDHMWAQKVRPFLTTQVYVDDILYFYDFDHSTSIRGGTVDNLKVTRPKLPTGFRFHPASDL